MFGLRNVKWIVRRDGVETAWFLTEYDADQYAAHIRETEAVKGFHMHVDVISDEAQHPED